MNSSINSKIKLEPGLIKLDYLFNGHPNEELALIMGNSLARQLNLPNKVLCYNYFLRTEMKGKERSSYMRTAFSGPEVRDEYIQGIEGRVVKLNPSFANFDNNFNPLLVPCNSPYFQDAIHEVERTILDVLKEILK